MSNCYSAGTNILRFMGSGAGDARGRAAPPAAKTAALAPHACAPRAPRSPCAHPLRSLARFALTGTIEVYCDAQQARRSQEAMMSCLQACRCTLDSSAMPISGQSYNAALNHMHLVRCYASIIC